MVVTATGGGAAESGHGIEFRTLGLFQVEMRDAPTLQQLLFRNALFCRPPPSCRVVGNCARDLSHRVPGRLPDGLVLGGRSLAQAWERLLKRAHPRRPRQLQTDQGKEFYNRPFQQVLKKHTIHHFSTYGDTKASVIERLNRTLKERLYRYLTVANTLTFVDVLPQVVQGYNASWHRSIGRAPQDVTPHNELQVWHRLYPPPSPSPPSPKLKAGDRVRLSKRARPFRKGYLPGWTEEVFVVRRVVPGSVPTYKVE